MAHISRRTLFGRTILVTAVGIGAVLGVGRKVHHKVAVPPAAPPTDLTAALARQQSLLAGYDNVAKVDDPQGSSAGLAALRNDVIAHGDALRGLLELYPGWRLAASLSASASAPPTPAPLDPLTSVAALAAASTAGATALTTAVLQWPRDDVFGVQVIPMLGSIAACLSSHALVLS